MAASALEGLRVLDLGGDVACAYCGRMFAEQGAEVINVEPPDGNPTRHLPPFAAGVARSEASALHAWLSTNKKSVVLDLPAEIGGLEVLLRSADVVLESGREGLDPGRLQALAPDAILVSIRWFGLSGARSTWRGTSTIVHALTGMLRGIGPVEGPPVAPSGFHAEIVGGLYAYVAAMGAVVARELGNDRGGIHLETSIEEANTCYTDVGTINAFNEVPSVGRLGTNRFPPTFPLGVYACRDGWIGLTVLTPAQWRSFCALIGLEEFADDEQYQSTLGRLEDADFLETLFAPKLLEWDVMTLYERAQAERIPLALVPSMEELLALPQYRERGAFVPVEHPGLPAFEGPGIPFRLVRAPALPGGKVAHLGADQGLLA